METLLPLAGFAFASSITPGPNNLMLSASGIAFGLRRTLPHLAGVLVGFQSMLTVCASGVGALVAAFPEVALAMRLVGSGYLLYLAWVMRNAFAADASGRLPRPLTFVEAVLFQFVNPKAWLMALTAVSVFAPGIEPRWLALAAVCGVFAAVGLPCIGAWALLGFSLHRGLGAPRWRDYLGLIVAVLMLYAVVAIWVGVDSPIAPMPSP